LAFNQAKYRKVENIHVFLWLVKDALWASHFTISALVMIAPTISAAIWLLYKNRKIYVELVHNLAILFWISANALWMISEFFNEEDVLKPFIISLFVIGITILALYYFSMLLKKNK
jgi:hypothetical protein